MLINYLAKILLFLLNFIANIFDYLYVFLKIYRILCFAKITFDQLPICNPYKWPIAFIRVVTRPYLSIWHKFLPNLRIGNMTHEVSSIIAVEFLSSIVRFSFYIRIFLYSQIDSLSAFIK